MQKIKHRCKKAWDFLWNDDSIWSWLANIVVAFLVIRFIVYPLLGVVLGTSFPIVSVVSESMEHGINLVEFQESFQNYWDICGEWYEEKGITRSEFLKFPLRDGFDKGDVIILWRGNNIKLGDILVFEGNRVQPIIHRVVDISEKDGQIFYQTKGDHNGDLISQGLNEDKISQSRVYGKGILRIPYLGWMKILFVDLVRPFGINIVK